MSEFFLQEPLENVDPHVAQIIKLEDERQNRKLIMIPSESSAPVSVRESLGSVLQNIYAEGYPDDSSRDFSEEEILDIDRHLTHYYRYSDPRYYKGVEYADILESLARKRCAELFANDIVTCDKIYVNVQPLSGAPANNAVYQALIEPGDAILGMNLFHGGHLTHGSSVNRSGKLYTAYHYSVDPQTEQINYDQLEEIAQNSKPKLIVAGYSSYPWCPNWKKLKRICDGIGAILFADISHIAGLIAAKVIPSPVGYADVITFTTHKTLCGPRGACILTFDKKISKKIDRAVFPGEQGGPHVQVFAAMATSFKLARTTQFVSFQNQIVNNCKALSNYLIQRGLRVVYGGTDTHLLNIDCKSVISEDGTTLSGDMAARVLDLVGVVVNANTIPGDKSSAQASGIRLGTPWITQRGLVEKDMKDVAEVIADTLIALKPYRLLVGGKLATRAKLDFKAFENLKIKTREIVNKAISPKIDQESGYPHFSFIDDYKDHKQDQWISFNLQGSKIRQSLNYLTSRDISSLKKDNNYSIDFSINKQTYQVILTPASENRYILSVPAKHAGLISAWLRDLSDGYIIFDEDLVKRIPGPFIVKETDYTLDPSQAVELSFSRKPYFVGIDNPVMEIIDFEDLPNFEWKENDEGLKRTALFNWHKENSAKIIPFAGWEMPVWYSSVIEEHNATRKQAGLFDVSHMGVYQAEGIDALSFLDSVCANDIGALKVGQSCYTHFLTPDADVIDDLLVYFHEPQKYLLVVNAANDEKDWHWLNQVKSGKVKIDNLRAWSYIYGSGVELHNLKNPDMKDKMRVDIALQGPASLQILNRLEFDKNDLNKINSLNRTELCHVTWKNLDVIISRTGYTGERIAYEIFIHPDASVALWQELIDVGTPLGLKPCGLGARDSLRTEAGLPLYGHEMAGLMNLGVSEAGFGSFVKTYKPWFIGRDAFIEKEANRKMEVIRFRFDQQRVRLAHYGDPVLDEKGKKIGFVTSCAVDSEGFINGQAYIEKVHNTEGMNINIFQSADSIKAIEPGGLEIGDRITIPNKATIVSRFAKL